MTNKTQTTAKDRPVNDSPPKPLACLPQPTTALVNGGEYLTLTGEKVKMSVDNNCKPGLSYHQFFGSNDFYYNTNGMVFNDLEYELDVVSEVPKITLEHGKTYVTAGGEYVTMKSIEPINGIEYYTFTGSNGYSYSVNGDFYAPWIELYKSHVIVSEYKEPQVQPKLFTAKELISAMSDSYNNCKSYGRIFSTSELQSLTKMQSKVITEVEREILELKETAAYLSHNSNSRVQELREEDL